jgi:hypothetical protein
MKYKITSEQKDEFIQLVLKSYLSDNAVNTLLLHKNDYSVEYLCEVAESLSNIKIEYTEENIPF